MEISLFIHHLAQKSGPDSTIPIILSIYILFIEVSIKIWYEANFRKWYITYRKTQGSTI